MSDAPIPPKKQLSGLEQIGNALRIPALFGQDEPVRFQSFAPGKKKPAAAPSAPPKPVAATAAPAAPSSTPANDEPVRTKTMMGGGLKIPALFGQDEPVRTKTMSFAPKKKAPPKPAQEEPGVMDGLFNCVRCVEREGKSSGPVPPWRQGSAAELPGTAPSKKGVHRVSVNAKAPPPSHPTAPPALTKRQSSMGEMSQGAASRKKDADESERIRVALLNDEAHLSTLLDGLTESQMQATIAAAERRVCAVGEEVVVQGNAGERLYVVDTGTFVVQKDGKLLEKTYKAGDCFGELALMFQAPRAATVKCSAAGTVWSLSGAEFRHTLSSSAAKTLEQRAAFLGTTTVFARLTDAQRLHLADMFEEINFYDGEKVMTLGEPADSLFILLAGSVSCRKADGEEDAVLDAGTVFGESSLEKTDGVRLRDVVALCDKAAAVVTCLKLQAQLFRERMGDLTAVVGENFKRRVLEGVEIEGTRLFDKIGKKQQEMLLSALVEREFEAGSHVIQQGLVNDTFYVIKSGVARVLQSKKITPTSSPKVTEVAQLSAGDFFGERALLTSEPAGATVKVWILPSKKPLTCYCLDRDAFTNLLGPLQDLLSHVVEERAHGPDVHFEHLKTRGVLDLHISTFGRYKLVTHMKEKRSSRSAGAGGGGRPFLLKCVRKGQVEDEPAKLLEEKRLLAMCKEVPFCLALIGTYQDSGELYFLREVGLGGDLKSLLHKTTHEDGESLLEDSACMFYAGCVIGALHHLHDMHILYRDLKPENLHLDDLGYPRLCDFGLAKELPDGGKTFTLCGTPEYMAPEVVKHKGSAYPADWWSLGIFTFELFVGKTPFEDDDPFQVTCKILKSQIKWPSYLDHRITHGADLIDNLLQVDQHKRLGSKCCLSPNGGKSSANHFNGSREVREHMWFHENDFDFHQIEAKEFPAPFIPRGAVQYEPANIALSDADPHAMLWSKELPTLLTDFGEDVSAADIS